MFVNIQYCVIVHRIYDKPTPPNFKNLAVGLWPRWINRIEIN